MRVFVFFSNFFNTGKQEFQVCDLTKTALAWEFMEQEGTEAEMIAGKYSLW